MNQSQQAQRKHQEDLQRLRNFRLMDDDFLTKCFEHDKAAIQLVLRIVLEAPDLEVLDVRTQVFVENLLNRSVRLDILATDSQGRKINVEIQRADRGAGRRRARYNSSMMDANLLEKGEDFDQLPETYVVFITERDVIGQGKPLYQVERCILGSGEIFGDGSHILYVNGAWRDDSPLGRLMHDFSCTDPADMHYDVLAQRVRFFKESKKGVAIMCKAMEEMRREEREEGIREGIREGIQTGMKMNQLENAKKMLEEGELPEEKVAKYSGLPLDEVKRLAKERMV